MVSCYSKNFDFVVPKYYCKYCNCQIEPGSGLYTVIEKWGYGYSACHKCFLDFEVEEEPLCECEPNQYNPCSFCMDSMS